MEEKNLKWIYVAREKLKGKALEMAEYLYRISPILKDLLIFEANNEDGNFSYGTLDLWSLLYRRLTLEKHDDTGDSDPFRFQQEFSAALEGFNVDINTDFFYGNGREIIRGLSQRYNSLKLPTVTNAGGREHLTSAYLVTHSRDSFYAHYPPKFPAGFRYTDQGKQAVKLDNGKIILTENYKLVFGFGTTLLNSRRCGRLCNIPTQELDKYKIIDQMCYTQNQLKNFRNGEQVWYVNRPVLRAIFTATSQSTFPFRLRHEMDLNQDILKIDGIKIECCEQISTNEERVQ